MPSRETFGFDECGTGTTRRRLITVPRIGDQRNRVAGERRLVRPAALQHLTRAWAQFARSGSPKWTVRHLNRLAMARTRLRRAWRNRHGRSCRKSPWFGPHHCNRRCSIGYLLPHGSYRLEWAHFFWSVMTVGRAIRGPTCEAVRFRLAARWAGCRIGIGAGDVRESRSRRARIARGDSGTGEPSVASG